ncbi:tripartite tricarboxylate transporter TctB family protein [Pacificibacter marinus]|uniref:Tripartite tricarboxylate transporter TctB family protein n=1 Tax=Pacificibacter marinus TaxID=658057 RepID=A0A1Y5TQ09_9RHOB|nr:tripartite tricarboxylate transporter TctB family protein [Pacificibacter marinus]SEL27802.1 putative tricarboxylic transport membrane protein [Pacificibacter marinus]SLN67281.1 Tripartite tricarboxylate transporter TctB family protein [Pacificibacter marinus]
MALDRWIALILAGICLAYGYTAWFTMDANLAPFMQRNPIWPSTFPKILSILGLISAFIILFSFEKSDEVIGDIDYRRLHEYKLGQALMLLGLMVIYALSLRPIGFISSTMGFLILGSFLLGERKWPVMVLVAFIAAFTIWYLVSEVLGIYMRPWPAFISNMLGG